MTDVDSHQILSALLDREPVDPDDLAALLEGPEARALLVDFVRLRSALHANDGEGAAAPIPTSVRRRSVARPILGIAAAILLVTAGALAGSRFAAPRDQPPPEPTRVVRLIPTVPTGGHAR